MTKEKAAIAFLYSQVARWRERGHSNTWDASPEEVKNLMGEQAMWDTPPLGCSEKELITAWSRGYLCAGNIHDLNAAEAVCFALSIIDPEKDAQNWASTKRRVRRILQEYGLLLQDVLNDFASGRGTRHTVEIESSPLMTRLTIRFLTEDPFARGMAPWCEGMIQQGYQSHRAREGPGVVMFRSQEDPIDGSPGVRVEMGQPITVTWPSMAHFWSNVQAWEDSDSIISSILTLPKPEENI